MFWPIFDATTTRSVGVRGRDPVGVLPFADGPFSSSRPGLSCRQGDQPPQVIGHGFEGEFELVFQQSQVAHAPVVLPFLEVREHPFDESTFEAAATIACVLFGGELAGFVGLLQNAVGDAVRIASR